MFKKVLFIAYQIPPIGGPATQRHLRFLIRLPTFDWYPVVLTVDPVCCEDYYPIDETLMKLLPSHIQVFRTKSYNPLEKLLQHREEFKGNIVATQIPGCSIGDNDDGSYTKGIVQLLKDVVSECFRIPDRQIGWYMFAVHKGMRIIRKEGIRVIYSSGNPWTSHLIGMTLSKLFRLPWVADFRDPWIHNPYKEKRFAFTEVIEKKLERKVIKNASFIIANTQPLQNQFITSYPELESRKFVHISNGYWEQLFCNLEYGRNDDKLIVSHVGSLYSNRSPLPILKAVSNLKKAVVIENKNFLLQLIGKIGVPGITQNLLLNLGIQDIVKLIPPVSHKVALQYLATSDVLLIIQPATTLQIPGKLFEYIGVGKPIFAITGNGATRDFVTDENLGTVASPEQIVEIENGLRSLVKRYQNGTLNTIQPSSCCQKFESLALTERLVQLFEDCMC